MLFRFCLYGFLKNQQYYDLFIILAFREKGLSFLMIGVLIAFREVAVNIMEVPTGAMADVLGRRKSMIISFMAYIAAFALFGMCDKLYLLFIAMFAFSVGEAFRTGTHKAMIFHWLERQDMADQKTAIYGQTRSWSKIGSAISVLIAAAMIYITDSYSTVFLVSIVPCCLSIINFLTYPSYLDGEKKEDAAMGRIVRVLFRSLRDSFSRSHVRRMLVESMCFEGVYKATKDYLQPVIQAAALALPFWLYLGDRQRTAILVAIVGFVLYLLSSVASRFAGRFAKAAGGESRASRLIWVLDVVVFSALTAGILMGIPGIAIGAFVALAILQNLWRPMLISRLADRTDSTQMATVLSIESQSKSLFAAGVAPLLGLAVDNLPVAVQFWPVGVLGLSVGMLMLLTGRSNREVINE